MSQATKLLSRFNRALLGRGFRPFFLGAAIYCLFIILAWSGFQAGLCPPPGALDNPVLWHAHEMIYGFTVAVIAGFLLTAVANWTGGAPVRHFHLLALVILWLTGRIAMNISTLPILFIAVADNLFIPALAISLAIPLLKQKKKRDLIFLTLLTGFFVCNILFFIIPDLKPLYAALMIVLTLISLIGGRIVPAFTVAGLRQAGHSSIYQTDQPVLDRLCLGAMIALAISFFATEPPSALTGSIAILAACLHALRFRHYHTLKTARHPMLWILQAGYGWLVIGLFLLGLSSFGLTPLTLALHTLTVGCIGSMCIGMMTRVTMGHTGRDIVANSATVMAFMFIQLAVVFRVILPVLLPSQALWIPFSGTLWAGSFILYLVVYSPMLLSPRPDGHAA